MRIILSLFFAIYLTNLSAQSMKWVVRDVSGIAKICDFSNSPPSMGLPIAGFGNGGQEEVNIMTDASNNILFITAADGNNNIQIRDASYNIMSNGIIRGDLSSLESAICKIPCTTDKFYFFNYKGPLGSDSLFYSIIDMSLNGGLGGVQQKNIFIGRGYTEGITISHQMRNGCRWLIVPGNNNGSLTLNLFKISNNGISSPLILDNYIMHDNVISPREVELSSDNKKLCVSTFSVDPLDGDIIVYDFNLENGTVSNRQIFSVSSDKVLGIEFSPDATKVYYQTNTNSLRSTLGRIDLLNGLNQIIDNTRYPYNGDPELAGNGKIYIASSYTENYLSEIGDPNNINIANVQYSRNAVLVSSNGCRPGLPNVIDGEPTGFSMVPSAIDYSYYSTSNCGEYIFMDSTCIGSWWEWNFGDGTISNQEFPIHTYLQNGNFNVSLRVLVCGDTLSISKNILINGSGNLNVELSSTAAILCHGSHNGSASAIVTGNPPFEFIWTLPNGDILNSSSISHLSGGNYTLNVIDRNGCINTQHFIISEPDPLSVSIIISNGDCHSLYGSAAATITGGTPPYTFLWNTNPLQFMQTVSNLASGIYNLNVTDSNNCISNSNFSINNINPVTFAIQSTPATCVANNGTVTVTHQGGTGNFSYIWSPENDTTLSTISGLIQGNYTVIATDLGTGCSQTLSTIVRNSSGLIATITSTTNATCETNEDGSATVAATGGEPPYFYFWPNGDITSTTNHLEPGSYFVRVEDYNGCPAYENFTIGFDFAAPFLDLGHDTMPCIGMPFILNAGPGLATYLWNDNSTNQTLEVINSGLYSVFVTSINGCENFDAINVNFVRCLNDNLTHINNVLSNIAIYPNPTNFELNVNLSHLQNSQVTLTITDLLGKILFYVKEDEDFNYFKKIDLQLLPIGIYFIKIEFNDIIFVNKILKK